MQRLSGKQRMQGVDTEGRRCAISDRSCEPSKVGEVANSPVIFAAQSVELTGQTPAAGAGPEGAREPGARRSNDQAELHPDPAGIDIEPVVAERQPRGQWQSDPPPLSCRRHCEPASALLPVLQPARPKNFGAAGWRPQRQLGIHRLCVNEVYWSEPQQCLPFFLIQRTQCRRRVVGKAESTDQRQQCLVGYLMVSTQSVGKLRLDADESGNTYERGAVVHAVALPGGDAPSAFARTGSRRGARLIRSTKERACSRYTSPGAYSLPSATRPVGCAVSTSDSHDIGAMSDGIVKSRSSE